MHACTDEDSGAPPYQRPHLLPSFQRRTHRTTHQRTTRTHAPRDDDHRAAHRFPAPRRRFQAASCSHARSTAPPPPSDPCPRPSLRRRRRRRWARRGVPAQKQALFWRWLAGRRREKPSPAEAQRTAPGSPRVMHCDTLVLLSEKVYRLLRRVWLFISNVLTIGIIATVHAPYRADTAAVMWDTRHGDMAKQQQTLSAADAVFTILLLQIHFTYSPYAEYPCDTLQIIHS